MTHSPSHQGVKLKDITEIHIIKVTNDQIEISAVVYDESQCVTLLIPVAFQHDCSSCVSSSAGHRHQQHHHHTEEECTKACVIENIYKLDTEAQLLLLEHDKNDSLNLTNQEAISTMDNNESLVQLLSWWISPDANNHELYDECILMKTILNQENFQPQMKTWAAKILQTDSFSNNANTLMEHIQKVVVHAVGPSGLFLRVSLASTSPQSSSSSSSSSILDIPYLF